MDRRVSLSRSLVLAAVAGTALSCDTRPSLSVELRIPASVNNVVSYELGAFPGGSCGTLQPTLIGGLPLIGTAARSTFPQGGAPLGLGGLAQGNYALGIVGRDATCKVQATGCSDVALDGTKSVSITVGAVAAGGGECSPDATCVNARCVPKPITETSGCTMSVVAYGALDGAIDSASVAVSGPAIVADDDGFRVGYRLIDPANGTTGNQPNSRYGYFTINNSGAVVKHNTQPFDDGCENKPLSDGLGFLRYKGKLLMHMSIPVCKHGSSTASEGWTRFVDWSNEATPIEYDPASGDRSSATPTLAMQGSVVPFAVSASDERLIVMRKETVLLGGTDSLMFQTYSSTAFTPKNDLVFMGPEVGSSVEAAASNELIATMTQGTGTVFLRAHNKLQDFQVPANVTEKVSTYNGVWGHIAVKNKRVFLLRGLDADATLTVHDPIGTATAPFSPSKPSDPGTPFVIPLNKDGGPPGGGALTAHGSRVFALIAQAQQGNPIITLATFAGASTKPFQTHATYITPETGAPTLATMRDARVAVAASRSRVLVVWVASASQSGTSTLKKGEALGGYMQFACTDESP